MAINPTNYQLHWLLNTRYIASFNWEIDENNSLRNFRFDCHDLSGTLIKVIPGDISTRSRIPMSFTVSNTVNCGILVCKYKQ